MAGKINLLESSSNKIIFLLDSGASNHINKEDIARSFESLENPIKISVTKSGESISATKRGAIKVTTNIGIKAIIEEALYNSEVQYYLLSVSKLQKLDMTVVFD